MKRGQKVYSRTSEILIIGASSIMFWYVSCVCIFLLEEFCQDFIAYKFFVKGLSEQLHLLKGFVVHWEYVHRVNVWVDDFLTFEG